jgi:hypothetical protein
MTAEWLRRLPQGDWLNRKRILAWSAISLAFQAAFLAFVALWDHGVFINLKAPAPTDFISFFAAGKQVLAGTPALAYVRAAHHAAEVAATGPGMPEEYFYYPPVFLLWCAPLALLPLAAAFVLYEAGSMAAWLLVMQRILRPKGWSWLLPMLAYPAVFWTALTGQNTFVVAALIGATTLLLDERPIVAGLLLGTVCFKPHLALLAPIALAAGGYWRTFTAAAVTVALWCALSATVFGVDLWRDYLIALSASSSVYETGRVELNAYITSYGAVRVLGGGADLAKIVQAVVSVLAAGAVAWIWRRNPGVAVRSAALAAGTLLVAPLALMYDLLLLTVAIAWLVRAGRVTGFLPWEKLIFFFCFLVPLLSRYLGKVHIPLGPLAPAAIVVLCLVRTVQAEAPGHDSNEVSGMAEIVGA